MSKTPVAKSQSVKQNCTVNTKGLASKIAEDLQIGYREAHVERIQCAEQ